MKNCSIDERKNSNPILELHQWYEAVENKADVKKGLLRIVEDLIAIENSTKQKKHVKASKNEKTAGNFKTLKAFKKALTA